jgi:hypothetical protein
MLAIIRRGTVTDIRARNQMFGGEPRWALSPYLAHGTGAGNNKWGNVHTQFTSTTGTAGASSGAISTLGSALDEGASNTCVRFNATISGTTMTVHSIASGGNNLSVDLFIRNISQTFASGANAPYRIQSQSSGTTGGVGVYTLTGTPAGGNVSAVEMLAGTKLACASGLAALQVKTVNGKKRYRMRSEYRDYTAAGQPTGRKIQIRMGDSASEFSNGLGTQLALGVPGLFGFSVSVDSATRAILDDYSFMLFWQHKDDDAAGGPKIAIDWTTAAYRGNNSTPPGAGTGPSVLMLNLLSAYTQQVRVIDNYPADTPLHFICHWMPGIAPWLASKVWAGAEYCYYGANLYRRTGTRDNGVTGGATPPTHGSGSVSDGGVTWEYRGAVPAGNVNPWWRVWATVGDAEPTLTPIVDQSGDNARTLIDPEGTLTKYAMSWGWYSQAVGHGPSPAAAESAWTNGDEIVMDWSEMTSAPLEIAKQTPNLAALKAWFASLRARF